jgi:hypothetical protein
LRLSLLYVDGHTIHAIIGMLELLFECASIQRVYDIGYHLTILAAVALIDDGKELATLCSSACAVALRT